VVEEERVPPSVLRGLEAVAGLKRGRFGARESRQVRPVDEFWVRKTMQDIPSTGEPGRRALTTWTWAAMTTAEGRHETA